MCAIRIELRHVPSSGKIVDVLYPHQIIPGRRCFRYSEVHLDE